MWNGSDDHAGQKVAEHPTEHVHGKCVGEHYSAGTVHILDIHDIIMRPLHKR